MRADDRGFPISFDVAGARVLLVGTDDDAARKRALLEEAGAAVSQVAPADFSDAAAASARLVLYTGHDAALAARIFAAARAQSALCWCADAPEQSDFAMPAVARLGQARFAIATGGGAPALASRLRAAVEEQLGDEFARFVAALAELRAQVQQEEPDFERRRARLTAALDGFALEIRARYPDWFTST
ncbi:MAG: putative Precorrin-2 dehydrogenase [Myxococcales bacterium]|nr:putative Precorrin-2 dehydrogenase [Myxococcales bacterium]